MTQTVYFGTYTRRDSKGIYKADFSKYYNNYWNWGNSEEGISGNVQGRASGSKIKWRI
mgnify:CR=1 FL=1